MLMHDGPLILDLAKADGQTKIELDVLAICFRSRTMHQGSDKSHVIASSKRHMNTPMATIHDGQRRQANSTRLVNILSVIDARIVDLIPSSSITFQHLENIYGNLAVGGRIEAIARARELRLL